MIDICMYVHSFINEPSKSAIYFSYDVRRWISPEPKYSSKFTFMHTINWTRMCTVIVSKCNDFTCIDNQPTLPESYLISVSFRLHSVELASYIAQRVELLS